MELVPVVKHLHRNSSSLTKEGRKQPQLKTQISPCFVHVLQHVQGKKKKRFFFFGDDSD